MLMPSTPAISMKETRRSIGFRVVSVYQVPWWAGATTRIGRTGHAGQRAVRGTAPVKRAKLVGIKEKRREGEENEGCHGCK